LVQHDLLDELPGRQPQQPGDRFLRGVLWYPASLDSSAQSSVLSGFVAASWLLAALACSLAAMLVIICITSLIF
jgi:hypothetical protein